MPNYPYEIIYTSNKNAYAKIDESRNLIVFSIPKRLKHDELYFHQFAQKVEQLRKRHQSKVKIERSTPQRLLMFGEEVAWSDFLGPDKKIPSQVTIEKKLKAILYDYAKERLDIFAHRLQMPYKQLIVKKSKAKRGSCSSDQTIMLNLSLIYLPREHIQYVIAHEAAHLIEKNHSSAFWNLVGQLFPDYKTVKKKMKNLIIQ